VNLLRLSVGVVTILASGSSVSARAQSGAVAPSAPGAPEAPRVVLLSLTAGDWREADDRVAAELAVAGFTVTREAARADAWPPASESPSPGPPAVASVALRLVEGSVVEVVLDDRLTRKVLLRRLPVTRRGAAEAGEVALAVVELLHASLLEVRLRAPGAATPTVTQKVDRLLGDARSPPPSGWILQSGLGPAFGLGSARPALPWQGQVGFNAGVRSPRGHRLSLELTVPVRASRLDAASGDAEVRTSAARAFLDLAPRGPGDPSRVRRLEPLLGLGLGAATIAGAGSPAPDYAGVGHERRAWTAVATLRAGLSVGLTRWLALRVWGAASAFLPEVDLRLDQQTVARLGLPTIEAGVSLDLASDLR
jgi:hypothetical protein